jgi:hypothetical protein
VKAEWLSLCARGLVDPRQVSQQRRAELAAILLGWSNEDDAKAEAKELEDEKAKGVHVTAQKRKDRMRGSMHRDVNFYPRAKRSDVDIGFLVGGGYLHYDYDECISTGRLLPLRMVVVIISILLHDRLRHVRVDCQMESATAWCWDRIDCYTIPQRGTATIQMIVLLSDFLCIISGVVHHEYQCLTRLG